MSPSSLLSKSTCSGGEYAGEERGAGVSRRRQFYENDGVVLVINDDDSRLDELDETTAA
jgi:hypothetical protein